MLSRSSLPVALAALFLVLPAAPRAADPPPKAVDFERDVKPIFAKHCVSCHGAEKAKSGLRLDQRTAALAGGDGGKVIVPGKSADSTLIKLVLHDDADVRMPPKKPRLAPAEIATLQAWIDQGAQGPDDAVKANPADWWSFKPLQPSVVPAGANVIDAFSSREAEGERADPVPRSRPPHAHPPALLRPHRPAADAGRGGRVRRRQGRRTPTKSWSIGCSRQPALRRAVGAALARRRPLRRDARVRQGPAAAERLAVPRLRHPRAQRGQALRAVRAGAGRRRRAVPRHGGRHRGARLPRRRAVGLHRPRRGARDEDRRQDRPPPRPRRHGGQHRSARSWA